MRVLFVTPPALKSHMYVQTPLAWALRTAGHEVRVAVQPDLAEAVQGTGLTAVVAGENMLDRLTEIDEAEPPTEPRPPGAPTPVQTDYAADDPHAELDYLVDKFLSRLCDERIVADMVDFARRWKPDLVIWDQLCYAGAVAARACGAAHARMLFGADALVQLRSGARRQKPDADPMQDWLAALLGRYGAEYADDAVTGHWTIDTMPPWVWRPEGPAYLPVRHLAFNGPSVVPDWVLDAPDRPRVALTLGLSHQESGVAHASTAELLDAVADVDAEVVAAIGGVPDGASAVPDNVRVVDFVPLNALLPSCAAVVHQGGTGTFAAGYEYGVPQLLVPSVYWSDKWFGPVAQASGLEQEGAGIYVADSDRLTADALREALRTVLDDPGYAANAARLRTTLMALPTPNGIVRLLEELTAEHRGRGA
ncbi:nucleotide disphospho-sugar-binding domain-containing protein [Actinoallomurus sp. NPDC050550]|uniref:nucleotide disphospho-sugar-binding domain-containing protein n=1 Tax=Actinoallomurus sp. NPDC050550 TaxID=3154937 RepID=UPI0033DB2DC5